MQCDDGDVRIIIEKLLDVKSMNMVKRAVEVTIVNKKNFDNTLALLNEHNKVNEVNYDLLQANCQHLNNFVENGLNELPMQFTYAFPGMNVESITGWWS